MKFAQILTALCALVFLIQVAQAENSWPQFRGPSGDGITTAQNVPTKWSQDKNVVWKTATPGKGWSSPVLVGNKIWMTTSITKYLSDEEKNERLKNEKPFQRKQALLAESIDLFAIEMDYETGKITNQIKLFSVKEPGPVHLTNSYASPTPVVEGKFVYCFFGTYGACCIDTDKKSVVWRNTENKLQHNVGPGSSPVLVDDVLVLTCDGVEKQYVTALDKRTGTTVWTTKRPPIRADDGDRRKAYATPLAIQHHGQTQVVIPGAQWVCSYNPANGEELWRVDHGSGFSNVPRPLYQDGVVYICTGFMRPELWAIEVDGRGDVTDSHVLWAMNRQVPATPSPILVDGNIYMVSNNGVGTCVDAESGDIVWTKRFGGDYSASPTFADGLIYFCNEDGKTLVIQPGQEFDVVAENELGEKIMASPIFLDGNIILRTSENIYRIAESVN